MNEVIAECSPADSHGNRKVRHAAVDAVSTT